MASKPFGDFIMCALEDCLDEAISKCHSSRLVGYEPGFPSGCYPGEAVLYTALPHLGNVIDFAVGLEPKVSCLSFENMPLRSLWPCYNHLCGGMKERSCSQYAPASKFSLSCSVCWLPGCVANSILKQ